MKRPIATVISCFVLGLTSLPANAAITTRYFKLTGTDWTVLGGNPTTPEVTPLTLEFTITVDDQGTVSPTNTGLTIHSFGRPYPLVYTNNPYFLVVASNPFDFGGGCANYIDNFCAVITNPFSAAPTFDHMLTAVKDGGWVANTRTIAWADGAVPEPASWAMMIGGLALAGGVMRRQRRAVASFGR